MYIYVSSKNQYNNHHVREWKDIKNTLRASHIKPSPQSVSQQLSGTVLKTILSNLNYMVGI